MTREQKSKVLEAVKRQLRIEIDLLDQGAMVENAVDDNDVSTEDEVQSFRNLLSAKIDKMISNLT